MARGHYRKRDNGKWQLEVDLGSYIDPKTGKKKRHKKYKTIEAKGSREVEKELIKFVAAVTGEGYYEPEKINFVDFVQKEWYPKHAEVHLSHTTISNFIVYLEARILPAFKYLRMDQIKGKHIVDFLHNLQEDGMRLDGKDGKLSSSAIFYHYRILNNIFNFAVKVGVMTENPCKKIDKPKVEYQEAPVYSLEETIQLLNCLDKEKNVPHWQIAIKLAITTGMRRSELFGLDLKKHIDLDSGILSIRQALTYSKEQGIQLHEIKKGNRQARKRDIYLSKSLIEPIKKLISVRNQESLASDNPWDEDNDHCLLLCDENGKPFNPTSLKNWWKRFLKRHNLKYIKIHSLRHTSATILINKGIDAKPIQERLGHADIQTTVNIYSHLYKETNQIVSEQLDDILQLNAIKNK
ncbi:site-specific integrase [Virgibacillus salexigens]|uniref:site-specific integrase n=1 Tax=Virgibacillus salexigens TaxID=61016 RepID=UPI00190E371E|nr:site-specific integrase [Virgibacillus salexigens]